VRISVRVRPRFALVTVLLVGLGRCLVVGGGGTWFMIVGSALLRVLISVGMLRFRMKGVTTGDAVGWVWSVVWRVRRGLAYR